MRCTRCDTETNPSDLFCPNCGSPLTSVCTKCGRDLAPGDRFCRSCGTPVNYMIPSSATPTVNSWAPPPISQASINRSATQYPPQVANPIVPPTPFQATAPTYPADRAYQRVGYRRPVTPRTPRSELVYSYKGVFPRFFAKVLDGFFLGIPLGLLLLIVSLVTGYLKYDNGGLAPLLLSLFSVVFIIIYIALEGGGGTPGKRILGMRIVDANKNNSGFVKALVRNLLGVVDFLPFAYLFGIILIASSQTKQRLGDRVAGTYVIGKE
jgi:uncharacterized RDD family membrane protein YckC